MTTEPAALLDAAERIGHALAADALWWEGRCTWTTDDVDERAEGYTVVHRTCPGDLYTGTAGIALFLARLAATVDDPVLARTARGALRHAASREGAAASGRHSLFCGRLGVAVAAALAGEWLRDDALLDAARAVALGAARGGRRGFAGADVLTGHAGGVAGALLLADRLDEPALVEWAAELGEAVLEAARPHAAGMHWPAGGETLGLCGLSHGAAGVAWALAELAAATGDARFAAASAAGLAYEASWFDAARGNWHDLFPENVEAGGTPTFGVSWCHGAPGIALARLRVWQLTGAPSALSDARAAVATTAALVRAALDDGAASYSLCHGLAGNADALLAAGAVLGDAPSAALAAEVAARGVRRHGAAGDWPAGVGRRGTTSPSLMLGSAGTGYFLLRVLDPAGVPSILLPHPLRALSPPAAPLAAEPALAVG